MKNWWIVFEYFNIWWLNRYPKLKLIQLPLQILLTHNRKKKKKKINSGWPLLYINGVGFWLNIIRALELKEKVKGRGVCHCCMLLLPAKSWNEHKWTSQIDEQNARDVTVIILSIMMNMYWIPSLSIGR